MVLEIVEAQGNPDPRFMDYVEIPVDDDSGDLDIYGYIQAGRPTVVFGEGGSGKILLGSVA